MVTDDWPTIVPVTEAEVRVIEACFGEVLDDLFGPLPQAGVPVSTSDGCNRRDIFGLWRNAPRCREPKHGSSGRERIYSAPSPPPPPQAQERRRTTFPPWGKWRARKDSNL